MFVKSHYNCEHLFRGKYEPSEEMEAIEKNQMKFLRLKGYHLRGKFHWMNPDPDVGF